MDINQFALYQLKEIPENRQIRFRSYHTLQEKGIQVRCEAYEQKYMGKMQPEDTPEIIRKRFDEQKPRNFTGHSISVSDVLVLNNAGEVTAYYVEKAGFIVIAGFIRNGSSGALISFDTTDFHIEGKEGSWLACDSIIMDGREFFLMEHSTYGTNAAWVVVDEAGKVVADNVLHGFDQTVKQQIRDYLNPASIVPDTEKPDGPKLENWQKFYENGEYLRGQSAEVMEEQNYSFIDGRLNNLPQKPRKIGGRISVLDRLHLKQAKIAKRGGKTAQQMSLTENIERRRQ